MEDEPMQYLLIVCDDPAELEQMGDAERARIAADYRGFTQSLRTAGHFRAGDALEPVSMATTVRLRHGRRLITDGPFAETREHLVGYYLVEAQDLDEAIGLAARIPSARFGAIEVRPVMRLTP
jgi:hypothetical protein